jgi:hypothetical protein
MRPCFAQCRWPKMVGAHAIKNASTQGLFCRQDLLALVGLLISARPAVSQNTSDWN